MYHKQLRECKNKDEVIERLKRTANIIKEGCVYTKSDEFIKNMTYRNLSQIIRKELERYLSTKEAGENGIPIDENGNQDDFDIDEFMKELSVTMNDDINDLHRDKDEETLDELIRELEEDCII